MRIAFVTWLTLALAASAQQSGIGGGTSASGSSGLGGGSGAGLGGGSGGTSGIGTSASAAQAGVSSTTLLGSFGTTSAARNNSAISTTNPFQVYYWNPYAQGLVGGNSTSTGSSTSVTGFGSAVYSSSALTGTGNRTGTGAASGIGSSGRTTGTGSTGTGLGGSTGSAGSSLLGGTSGATGGGGGGQQGTGGRTTTGATPGATAGVTGTGNTGMANRGQQTNFAPAAASGLKSGVLYTTTIRFETTPVTASQMQTQLGQIISRSTHLKSPGNVRVEFDSGKVILRGTVANEDESAHVENLLRLEPGVRDVKNELQIRQ